MSTNLTGRTSVVIDLKNVNEKISTTKLADTLDELNITSTIKWSFGDVLKGAEVLFHSKRTIAQAGSESLLLNDSAGQTGVLKLFDAFGDPLTMTAIKFLYIKNTSAILTVSVFGDAPATNLPILTGGGTTAADPPITMELPPEGFMFWACPKKEGIPFTTKETLKLAVSALADADDAIIEVVAMGLD